MRTQKILTVYNTCGVNGDKTDWYSKCLESVLGQDHPQEVVVSSCLNSDECINTLKERFGNDIKICRFFDRYIVNTTFNKTVLEFGKGKDAYFFIDSGVELTNKSSLSEMVKRLKNHSMVTLQTDTDTGFETIGGKQDSNEMQVTGEDFVLPLGKAINLHAQLFSRHIQENFGLVIPDVFAAYCTESTFPFLNASVMKKWCIVADVMCHHNKAVDGPSSTQPHWSPVHRSPWNNLLYGRNALDFINDAEAKRVGLGYEECGGIMPHDPDAYDNELAKYPISLSIAISKYFYTNKSELDYDSIRVQIY